MYSERGRGAMGDWEVQRKHILSSSPLPFPPPSWLQFREVFSQPMPELLWEGSYKGVRTGVVTIELGGGRDRDSLRTAS